MVEPFIENLGTPFAYMYMYITQIICLIQCQVIILKLSSDHIRSNLGIVFQRINVFDYLPNVGVKLWSQQTLGCFIVMTSKSHRRKKSGGKNLSGFDFFIFYCVFFNTLMCTIKGLMGKTPSRTYTMGYLRCSIQV